MMTEQRYVVCVTNDGYPASLEVRKLYLALPDADAEKDGYIRVVDEEGEDYLYPARFFAEVQVAPDVAEALAAST